MQAGHKARVEFPGSRLLIRIADKPQLNQKTRLGQAGFLLPGEESKGSPGVAL